MKLLLPFALLFVMISSVEGNLRGEESRNDRTLKKDDAKKNAKSKSMDSKDMKSQSTSPVSTEPTEEEINVGREIAPVVNTCGYTPYWDAQDVVPCTDDSVCQQKGFMCCTVPRCLCGGSTNVGIDQCGNFDSFASVGTDATVPSVTVPTPPSTSTDSTDTTDVTDSTDTTDEEINVARETAPAATDSTDTPAATDSTDTPAAADSTDTTDAADSTDTTDAADSTDTTDATDSTDTTDATDSTDTDEDINVARETAPAAPSFTAAGVTVPSGYSGTDEEINVARVTGSAATSSSAASSVETCGYTSFWDLADGKDTIICENNAMCSGYKPKIGTGCCLVGRCICGSTAAKNYGIDRCLRE
jgi:hypothetical protein